MRTFVRDGKEVAFGELKCNDVFYFYDGDFDQVPEFRLWKMIGTKEDGAIVADPLTIMVKGQRPTQEKVDDQQEEA